MIPIYRQQLPGGTTEIRSGRSSWENGADTSVKFAWPDKNGRIARGGEVPCAMAVPMALHVLRYHPTEVSDADLRRLQAEVTALLKNRC
jgi:hypothetical protein